jgi:putative transposase
VSIPSRSTFRPKLPKYKHKTAGPSLLVYEWGAIRKRELNRGVMAVDFPGELVQTKQTRKTVKQVRLVPKGDHYVLEVVSQREVTPAPVDPELFVAADLGVNVPFGARLQQTRVRPAPGQWPPAEGDQSALQQRARPPAAAVGQVQPFHLPRAGSADE